MTDELILKLSIEKAIKNGYKPYAEEIIFYSSNIPQVSRQISRVSTLTVNDIVFNHAFAKAFFGEGKKTKSKTFPWSYDGVIGKNPRFKYQLQQMVISDNPIQYLKQFLEEKKG